MAEDLRGTPAAQVIEAYIEANLAQGNERDATVERLEREGTVISFRIQVKHKQVAKVRIPGNGTISTVVYAVTTPIEGRLDLQNPNPDDVKFSVDTPVGRFSVSLLDVFLGVFGA